MLNLKSIPAEFLTCSVLILLVSCKSDQPGVEVIKLADYPSASGVEFYNNRYYLIGDDATQLLLLDQNFKVTDSIPLYPLTQKRIPKDSKADLEAITVLSENDTTKLLLIGSGSLTPYRNTAWLINPADGRKESLRLDSFYQLLMNKGLKEINIEGACSLPGSIILSNRGHKAWPENYLIITRFGFWQDTNHLQVKLLRLAGNEDSLDFRGVSGLAYATESDYLILTISTEDTKSVYEDGAIGKSYLWIVQNISDKLGQDTITPDYVIDLDSRFPVIKNQKIESPCVIGETGKLIHLVLVADNDDGSSTLFKLSIEKNGK